jgi:hypothetical protein
VSFIINKSLPRSAQPLHSASVIRPHDWRWMYVYTGNHASLHCPPVAPSRSRSAASLIPSPPPTRSLPGTQRCQLPITRIVSLHQEKRYGRKSYTAATVVVSAQSRGHDILDVLCGARMLWMVGVVDGHVSGASSTSGVDGALESWDFEVLLRLLISIGGFPDVSCSSAAFSVSAMHTVKIPAALPSSGFRAFSPPSLFFRGSRWAQSAAAICVVDRCSWPPDRIG